MTIEEALKKLAKLQLKDGYILGLVPDVVIGNSRASRWCVYAVNLWSKVPDSLISSGSTPMEAIALAEEALSDARYCSIPVIPIRLYTEHGE